MLNSDLISARLRKEQLLPNFLRPPTALHLAIVRQMLSLYREAAQRHASAGEMESVTTPVVNGAPDRRFAMAIRKLLDDRCVFSHADGRDYAALRDQLFRCSSALLQGTQPLDDLDRYRQAIRQRLPENELLRDDQIYGDLPDYDCLDKFDDLTEQQLLERYDISLVQSLLLSASHLDVLVRTREIPRLRRLFKYLRFFQLLCTIEGDDDKAMKHDDGLYELKMVIDGPASILEQSRRYGLQLAIFFPAICTMDEWRISARVEWRGHPAMLTLDQESQLKCPYHNFAAYIPDEIRLFSRHFAESIDDWRIITDVPFLRGAGREVIVPDFSFANRHGRVVHLELFNRWHANGLAERIAWLEKHPKLPLVLGVDKSLVRKPEIAEVLGNSPWFAQFGFTYRDYPTCDKTRRILERRCVK